MGSWNKEPKGPKDTNLVDDVEILLTVKFCWMPFSDYREVKNVSANQTNIWSLKVIGQNCRRYRVHKVLYKEYHSALLTLTFDPVTLNQ